jgi:hypothetical protein
MVGKPLLDWQTGHADVKRLTTVASPGITKADDVYAMVRFHVRPRLLVLSKGNHWIDGCHSQRWNRNGGERGESQQSGH